MPSQPAAAREEERKLHRDPNLRIVFCVTLIMVLGVSSIIPVLPGMAETLGFSVAKVGLVITLFTLPGILLAPLSGVLADRLGRKAVLLPALLIFALGGTACAFTDSFGWLLFWRFVQGMGAGPLGVLSQVLIGDLYSGRDVATAMGYNAGVLSVGTAAYPALGGLLGYFGWHWPFLLSLVALPVAWLVATKLDVSYTRSAHGMGSYMRKAVAGMRSPLMAGIYLSVFATFMLLYGPLITFYPVLVDQRFGAGPMAIGILISLASLGTALASSQLGRIVAVVPERVLVRIGFGCYALCFAITPWIGGFWGLAVPLLFFGAAQGLTIPSLSTLLVHNAPTEFRGGYMAVYGMLLRLGQCVAPILTGGIYALAGIGAVFAFGALLALLMVPAAWRLITAPVPGEDVASAAGRG